LAADGNGDNVVNNLDYSFWKSRFGNTSGSGSALGGASVPEPASLLLMSLAIAFVGCGRRAKQK
jgi:hypothetical protein